MTNDPVSCYFESFAVPGGLADLARRDIPHFVGGSPRTSRSDLPVFEPFTGAELCRTFEAGADLVDAAVHAAKAAFVDPAWAGLRALDRQALIHRLADQIEAHADELAFLESVDVGKPIAQAREIDIGGSVDVLRYFAGWASKIDGRSAPLAAYGPESFGLTLKRPVGIVAAIVPWNFPLQTLVWKAAAALAAGCTLVVKPSEVTPLTAFRFAELATEAGFPPGVINIVNGTGPTTGAVLVAHPEVDKVTFTGSTRAGQIVGRTALEGMKRLTLELGGKSPVLVTASADLELAVDGIINGIFFNAGQVCDAGSRLIVDEKVADQLLELLVDRASDLSLGPGLNPDTFIGPLATKAHLEKVQGYLDRADADGLDFALRPETENGEGYLLGPAIVQDCPTGHPVWREEIFGPVLAVVRASSRDQMVQLAADTEYGLGAAVFSEDQREVLHLSRSLKAGTVYVNGHGHLDPSFPFGGQRHSGFGKDLGPEQLESYLETTSVLIAG